MASSKNYLQFVLEQLSELDEITYRTMMGEFIIYYRGKIVILSILVYTFFSRMFDLMLPPVAKHSIVVA